MTNGKIIQVNDNLSRISHQLAEELSDHHTPSRVFKEFKPGRVAGSGGWVDTIIGIRHDDITHEWPRWMVEVISEEELT